MITPSLLLLASAIPMVPAIPWECYSQNLQRYNVSYFGTAVFPTDYGAQAQRLDPVGNGSSFRPSVVLLRLSSIRVTPLLPVSWEILLLMPI